MAKIAVVLVGLFCLIQMGNCAPMPKPQDEAIPITTESIFDTLKRGFERTFTKERLDESKKTAEDTGEKLKEFTNKAVEFIQVHGETFVKNLTKKDEKPAGANA